MSCTQCIKKTPPRRGTIFLLILAALCLAVLTPTMALAQGEPLSPAEMEGLSELEAMQPVLNRTAGDYNSTIHMLSSIMQYAFLFFPPLLIVLLIPRVYRIFTRARQNMLAMTQEAEGRQFRRIMANPQQATASVYDPSTGSLVYESGMLDLSVGGICMEGPPEELLEYERKYRVRIGVKDEMAVALTDLSATMAWAHPPKIGLQFDRLLPFSYVLLAEMFAKRELRINTNPKKTTVAIYTPGSSSPVYEGGLININKGGICLLADQECPIEAGQECSVMISNKDGHPVVLSDLAGTIAWIREGKVGMQFMTALQLSSNLLSKMFAVKQVDKEKSAHQ